MIADGGGDVDSNMVGEAALVPSNLNAMVLSSGNVGTVANTIGMRKAPSMPKPKWHPPWKLFRVISGHLGWVRSVAVEPGNEWFATGSADRVIKASEMCSYLVVIGSVIIFWL